MFLRITFLFVSLITITALQITPLKSKVEYFNPKYIKYTHLTIKKTSRHSPYYVNADAHLLSVIGNNVTVSLLALEYISGRYIPTAFSLKYKLCDFLDEPLVGQLVVRALPANAKCPFPIGYVSINNFTLDISQYPFMPVFTYSNLQTQGRIDVNLSIASTGETLIFSYAICMFTQSLESKSIKIPTRTPKPIN